MSRPTRVLVPASLLAVLVAACSAGATQAPGASSAPPAAATAAASGGGRYGGGYGSAASAAPAASAPAAASGSAVTIQNLAFGPATLTVAVGTTVTWTNRDSIGHTVTADDGSFDSGTVAPGATFTRTFTKAGTYAYHCKIHPFMKASIVVH